MSDAHVNLVEEVADELASHCKCQSYRLAAEAIIALIAERTKEATDEMMDAWNNEEDIRDCASIGTKLEECGRGDWRSMHAASARRPYLTGSPFSLSPSSGSACRNMAAGKSALHKLSLVSVQSTITEIFPGLRTVITAPPLFRHTVEPMTNGPP